jgi:acetolactate synthase regulatory subunit
MTKSFQVITDNGSESLMRITALMRRKGCFLKKITMEQDENSTLSDLTFTIGFKDKNIPNLISQVEKFQDVHSIREIQ